MATKAPFPSPDTLNVPEEDRFRISDLSPERRKDFSPGALKHALKLRQQARVERLTRADRKRLADLKALKT